MSINWRLILIFHDGRESQNLTQLLLPRKVDALFLPPSSLLSLLHSVLDAPLRPPCTRRCTHAIATCAAVHTLLLRHHVLCNYQSVKARPPSSLSSLIEILRGEIVSRTSRNGADLMEGQQKRVWVDVPASCLSNGTVLTAPSASILLPNVQYYNCIHSVGRAQPAQLGSCN